MKNIIALCAMFYVLGCGGGGSGSDVISNPTDTTPVNTQLATPKNISVVSDSRTSVSISWEAVEGAAMYDVFVNGSKVKTLPAPGPGSISYLYNGLTPATEYCCSVKAVDSAGNESLMSVQVCATTFPISVIADTETPAIPANVSAIVVSQSEISLSWNASTDNVGVAGYRIYRDGNFLKAVRQISASDTGLSASTQYCYNISAYDTAGNESPVGNQACATTLTDATVPHIMDNVVPGNNDINVPVNTVVSAKFSEAMDQATINNTTFSIVNFVNGDVVAGSISYNPATNIATFTPSANLSYDTVYTVKITTGVKDVAGNPMTADYRWSFRTSAVLIIDTTPPNVLSVSPADNATGVAVNTAVSVVFDEAMDAATIAAAGNFRVEIAGLAVSGSVSYDVVTHTATLIPSANLAYGTIYDVRVRRVTDTVGNELAADYRSSFTTGADPNVWALQAGANIISLAVDSVGSLYASGGINGSLPGFTNAGGADVFAVKFNSAGTLEWQLQKGTPRNDATGRHSFKGDNSGQTFFFWGESGVNYSYLSSFDESGAELYTALGPDGFSAAAVGDFVYVNGFGKIYKINKNTGAEVCVFSPSYGGQYNDLFFFNGFIYAVASGASAIPGSDGGFTIVKMDSNCNEVWVRQPADIPGTVYEQSATAVVADSSGVYAGGNSTAGGNYRYIVKKFGLDGSDGWFADLAQFAGSIESMVFDNFAIYDIGSNGLVRLDKATGVVLNSKTIGYAHSLAIYNGVLFIADGTNVIKRYRADTLEKI